MSTRAIVMFVGTLVTASASAPAAQTPVTLPAVFKEIDFKLPGGVKPTTPEPKQGEVKVLPLPHVQPDNPKNPYRDIFDPQKRWPDGTVRLVPHTVMRAPDSPRVVCGMVVIPVDPNIDPGIIKVPDRQTDYAIRRIKPPVCIPE